MINLIPNNLGGVDCIKAEIRSHNNKLSKIKNSEMQIMKKTKNTKQLEALQKLQYRNINRRNKYENENHDLIVSSLVKKMIRMKIVY